MEDQSSAPSVTVSPTFWETFKGAILMIPHQGLRMWIFHSIFPLIGLFMLIFPQIVGQPVGIWTTLIAVVCGFGFTPLVYATVIARVRRSKVTEPPITYRLDDEGVHLAGKSFAQDYKWTAIPKCRLTASYFYLFLGNIGAIAIAVDDLKRNGVLEEFCKIARKHTDFR